MKSTLTFLLLISLAWMNLCYAQISYTDINPDTILIGSQSAKYLDIDNDNTNDFALFHDTIFRSWANDSGMVNGIAHFNGNLILCSVEGHMYPRAILYNYLLDEQSGDYVNFEKNVILFTYAMVQGEYQNWGYFQKMTYDKYVGLKFFKDGNIHFGWVRIFINPDATFIICKDYAYNTVPNEGIYAGEGIPTGIAKNIVATDVSDFGNGKDLKLTFNKADDEFTVKQYRAFIVKANDSTTFDIQTAIAVSPGNFINISPNGKDQERILFEVSKDVDGDLVAEDQEYLVYIVSYPSGLGTVAYQMNVSNTIMLKNSSAISETNGDHLYFFNRNNNTYLNGTDGGVDFIIYDLSGKVLKSYENISSTIPVDGLKKGIYILTAIEHNSIRNYKLYIKE